MKTTVIEGGRRAEGHNPLCGDRITVHVRLDADVIQDVSFDGSGCAIAKASASLMTESVKGLTRADALSLLERFHRMITAPPYAPIEELGTLTVLAGVRQFPTRVKCAAFPGMRCGRRARLALRVYRRNEAVTRRVRARTFIAVSAASESYRR